MNLRRRWNRTRDDADHADEYRAHLERHVSELMERGMSEQEARHAANLRFGNTTALREDVYRRHGMGWLEAAAQDARYGLRMLLRNPGFTVIAVLCLAIGIGSSTSMFTVVKAVVLNKLPYRNPERLVTVAAGRGHELGGATNVGFTTGYDWRRLSRSFEHMTMYRGAGGVLIENGEPELLNGIRLNYDFFDMVGVRMEAGRNFTAEEDRPDRRFEVILSHGLWTRRFGGDPKIVGRVIHLSEAPFTVVGVLPANFRPLFRGWELQPDIFLPLAYDISQPNACRSCEHLRMIARLKPGVSASQAQSELAAIMRELVRQYPDDYAPDSTSAVRPLRDQLLERAGTALWILLGAVALLLLIGCANVANLMLARSAVRGKEMALRAAVGGARGRLARQLLTESLLLSGAGGLAGAAVAWGGTGLLVFLGPKEIPRLNEIHTDPVVLGFGVAMTLLTGVLSGLAPALRGSRVDLNAALKDSGRSTADRSRQRLRTVLVSGELAVAFVVVLGAGLLGRSFLRLMNVDPGYDPHHVISVNTFLYGARYRDAAPTASYYREVLARLRATPGVESAALTSTLPLDGLDNRGFHVQDRPTASPADVPAAAAYYISPDYFSVMRIPLKRGRTFTAQDSEKAPAVALISESGARSQFPNEDAIGKRIQLGGRSEQKPWATIVGIVGDVHQNGLELRDALAAYMPAEQNGGASRVVVRTSLDPHRMEKTIRDVFAGVDRTQPIFNLRTLESTLQDYMAERQFTLILLALFGAMALSLAALGVYGVISYSVTLRRREMGVRMALGAGRAAVVGMILRDAVALSAAGLAVGFAASMAVTRWLANILFEVTPTDPGTSLIVAALLGCVALLASYAPARRAAKVDPMSALRGE
jgi:putative ABC transport system permease protein